MMWRDVVTLGFVFYNRNEFGDVTEMLESNIVFANKKSVRQSEFYQAHTVGFRPEVMFEVRTIDYRGEQKLDYNGKQYDIIRTYSKNDEITELVCQTAVNKGVDF